MNVLIERCTANGHRGWLELRRELWPGCADDEHLAEMSAFCAEPGRFAQFIAYDESGRAVGFVEASIRRDYVNGARSSRVAFLEGLHVVPGARRHGIGRELVERVELWASAAGCSELASDALLDNRTSHAMHEALDFVETERVVFFRKELPVARGHGAPAPIVISEYSADWPRMFAEEAGGLRAAFAPDTVEIEHVGSTAVPGMGAKPVVDILLGAQSLAVIEGRIGALEARGYRYVPEFEALLPQRRYFAKPKDGPAQFQLHAVERGSAFWDEQAGFRDVLRSDPAIFQRYLALKRRLAESFRTDIGGYTEAKAPFIRQVLNEMSHRADRRAAMPIHLDHFTVPSRDRVASAKLLARILGAPWAEQGAVGPFSPVYVNDGLTLDFDQMDAPFPMHHYCFRVDEKEFNAVLDRIKAAGIEFRSTPHGPVDMQVNTQHGGSIVYWNEPDGHQWELLTVSYARGGAAR